MIQRENIKIIVGGNTIGVAESAQLTFTDDSEPSTRDRSSIKIRAAEMVVTPEQQERLRAIIHGGTIGHGCTIHPCNIKNAIKNLKHRRL